MKKQIAAVATVLVVVGAPAAAAEVTLSFEDIPALGTEEGLGSEILGYYNGDPEQDPKRTGAQDEGITFNAGTLAIKAKSAGGAGGFDPLTGGGDSAAGRVTERTMSFTLDAGLSLSSLSFFYAGIPESGPTLRLYSLDEGTGEQKVRFTDTLKICSDVSNGAFCKWARYELPEDVVDGLLKEALIDMVAWEAEPNQFVVDLLSIGTRGEPEPPPPQPAPEPSTTALLALGLAALGWSARRRRH